MNSLPADATVNSEWGMKHLIAALFLILFLTLAISMILSSLLRPNHLIAHLMSIGIDLIAIFYLNNKYPLMLSSTINSKRIAKYIFIGALICLVVNFPHKIWTGNLKSIPTEYIFFTDYSLFEKGLFLLMLCLIGPLTEEILFRGFFYRIVKNRYDIFWGVLISTAIYTVFHGLEMKNLIYIAIPSLIYTYVYEKSGSIWASILVHSLNNTLWFVFVYLGVRNFS